jgi:hypothetical protein
MRQPIPDLWPDDLFGPAPILPRRILHEQGEILRAKTGRLVFAVVETQAIAAGNRFEHTFVLVAPVLHFRYPLLRVVHETLPFPATVIDLELTWRQNTNGANPSETVSDEGAFLQALSRIFHQDQIIALLRSLIGQSADHTRPFTEQPNTCEEDQPLIVPID